MANNFTIPTIFTAIDKLSRPVQGMENSLKGFERTAKRLQLQSKASMASGMAKDFAVAGAAIAAPLALAVNESMKYEKALASFRTIVSDISDNEFVKFESAIQNVAGTTRRSFTDVASSFEMIAGLNADFAKTADGLSLVSEAAITLSKASGSELSTSAENLVGIMNQFSLGATEANRTINVLAAGQAIGAANIAKTSEAFVNFGSVASGANITLEQSVALIQTLAQKQLLGAEAGTKLRGAVLKLQQAGLGYASGQFNINDALSESVSKISKLKTEKAKDAALTKIFGAENITAGRILLSNIETFNKFTDAVTGTKEAQKAAEINSKTFSSRLAETRAQMQNLGVKVGEVLLPALISLVDKISPVIQSIIEWMRRNPGLTKMIVYATAFISALAFAISGLFALYALWTKAQILINIVMSANPIGLVIVAIAALIGFIVAIIQKWNEWGAAMALLLGPLGRVISLIQSFRRNWDMIKKSFKEGGILSGIKAIGITIIDSLLMPVQQLVSLIGKITGADWAKDAAASIQRYRDSLGVNTATDESGNPLEKKAVVNTRATQQEALFNEKRMTNDARVDININDPTGRTTSKGTGGDFLSIKTTSTHPGY